MRNVSGMVSRGAATTHCYVTTVTLHTSKKIVPPSPFPFSPCPSSVRACSPRNMLSSRTKGEKRRKGRGDDEEEEIGRKRENVCPLKCHFRELCRKLALRDVENWARLGCNRMFLCNPLKCFGTKLSEISILGFLRSL